MLQSWNGTWMNWNYALSITFVRRMRYQALWIGSYHYWVSSKFNFNAREAETLRAEYRRHIRQVPSILFYSLFVFLLLTCVHTLVSTTVKATVRTACRRGLTVFSEMLFSFLLMVWVTGGWGGAPSSLARCDEAPPQITILSGYIMLCFSAEHFTISDLLYQGRCSNVVFPEIWNVFQSPRANIEHSKAGHELLHLLWFIIYIFYSSSLCSCPVSSVCSVWTADICSSDFMPWQQASSVTRTRGLGWSPPPPYYRWRTQATRSSYYY